MPGIVALRRSNEVQPYEKEEVVVATKNGQAVCHECDLVIANADERVTDGDKVFHKEPCARKYARSIRIRELFIRNAAEQGLSVVPRHSFGK